VRPHVFIAGSESDPCDASRYPYLDDSPMPGGDDALDAEKTDGGAALAGGGLAVRCSNGSRRTVREHAGFFVREDFKL
jgi:hypothetical protein